MQNHKLIIKNLSKKYKERTILKDISMEINSGEIIGLLGPNGAGKTTCFYSILGLTKADTGDIYLNQNKITNFPIHKRAKLGLGYLPQEMSIFRSLSVRNNILSILELRNDINKEQQYNILEELLREFQIEHIANSIGNHLSGGERRRVEIARCVAQKPKFILLDEPFAGISPIAIQDIKKIIKELAKKEIGILITDHNVRDTLSICDTAYIISDGLVLTEGTPNQILGNKEAKSVYLGESFSL
tara:strand:- start:37852 stop:38583 length:732 start_codon:yes stop_codon:yes gene_type:complete